MKSKAYIAIAILGCVLLGGQAVGSGFLEFLVEEDAKNKKRGRRQEVSSYDNFAQEIDKCNSAIALNPNDAKAYNRRGYFYYLRDEQEPLGPDDKALKDYSKAIALAPNNAKFYGDRGYFYLQKGKYEKAITDYTKAISLESKNLSPEDLYIFRAAAYAENGENDKAIGDFNKALVLTSKKMQSQDKNVLWLYKRTRAGIYFNRGGIYFRKKRYAQAIEDVSVAITLNPDGALFDSGAYYRLRGKIFSYQGSPGHQARTIEDFNKAIKATPLVFRPAELVHFGLFFKIRQENALAANYFYKAGLLHIKQNNHAEALKAYSYLKRCNIPELAQKLFSKLYSDGEQKEPPKLVKLAPAPPPSLIKHGNLKRIKLTGEYRYTYGDSESLVGAKQTCQSMAVRNALESHKTFVTATSEVKDYQLKEDLIKTVSSSYIEDLKVLEEEISGRTIYTKIEGYIVPEILDMALRAEVQRLQRTGK